MHRGPAAADLPVRHHYWHHHYHHSHRANHHYHRSRSGKRAGLVYRGWSFDSSHGEFVYSVSSSKILWSILADWRLHGCLKAKTCDL